MEGLTGCLRNSPLAQGKEGNGEVLRRLHAVANRQRSEAFKGCLDEYGKAGPTTPWRCATAVASRHPLC